VGHAAKKPSLSKPAPSPAAPATRAAPAAPGTADEASSPLRDKAASDAEAVEPPKSALAPVDTALTEPGEEAQRPETAANGPAEMDMDMKDRSAQIMQDFFKETSLRDKLQEQCDDLSREVENLQLDKSRLKKQLQDAQAAMAEMDEARAVAQPPAVADDGVHNALVQDMEVKFAHETKQLEEQSQKLEAEKQAAQEKSVLEAARASELQQVLDDLNKDLEQQEREWDAEKKILAEQASQIEEHTRQVTQLKGERDALSVELASTKNVLDTLQTQFVQVESRSSDDLQARDAEIQSLKMLVDKLQSEIATSKKELDDAVLTVQRSLDAKSSETSAVIESLESQIESLHQQHTDELHVKDEAIALHVETQKGLYDDITTLQQRANQVTAMLESERNAHAEELQAQVDELQKTADEELRIREEEVSHHLKSIDGLQEQIKALEQGSTDGARVAGELRDQIEELKSSHEAAIKVKTDENHELVQQLDAMNEQLGADAMQVEQLKDELAGLRKAMETFDKTSQQQESQHASVIAKIHADLNDAVSKADTYKLELDAAHEKHKENLRVLSEDHQSKIESLKAGLEGDAKLRLNSLQVEVDSLKSEKDVMLKQHEEAIVQRDQKIEKLIAEKVALQESSGSVSQKVDELRTKCQQVEDDKAALMEAHTIAQKETENLHAQLEDLTKQAAAAEDLQLRLRELDVEKAAAEAAHVQSQSIITDLQARCDALVAEKSSIEETHRHDSEALKKESEAALNQRIDELLNKHEVLLAEKNAADELHTQEIERLREEFGNAAKGELSDLQSKYNALLEEKSANDIAHTRALEAHKEESANRSTSRLDELEARNSQLQQQFEDASQALSNLQTEHRGLAEEKVHTDLVHKTELEKLQEQLVELEKIHSEDLVEKATTRETHTKELASQQSEIERGYASILEALQNDAIRLEQEKSIAVNELRSVKEELKAQIDDLNAKLDARDRSGSVGLAEANARYETLLAEKVVADKAYEDAIAALQASLEDTHQQALAKLRSDNETLQQSIVRIEQEHSAAIELLKEELTAGHSKDVQSLQQQLAALQEQHKALTEQKTFMEQAHDDAISELMIGMQASTSDAVQQLQKEHDTLVAQLEAMKTTHATELESARQDVTDQQLLYRDLLSRNDKAIANADAHAQEVQRLMNMIQSIESERAQAIQAAQDAEDRIETMKGEVVRKHLARVEPLEKENAMLFDKVDRLEAILAAGDRVARAAASMGEKRNITTLIEEEDEEEERDTTSAAAPSKSNGVPTAAEDVVGTQLAAMQETLHQLSELNNDAIAESSRTAQRLAEQH